MLSFSTMTFECLLESSKMQSNCTTSNEMASSFPKRGKISQIKQDAPKTMKIEQLLQIMESDGQFSTLI